ncbi:MAG: hypothetical protein ACXWB9_02435 [Flavisolibacter sp.]
MKKLTLFLLVVSLLGCDTDKVVEEQQTNLVIQAITTGYWKVQNFTKGSTDVTADFSTYKFKFNSNYTVDALKNGTIEKSGTWTADPDAQTITSNFTNAIHPLVLLNGTFDINSTTWTSVDASQNYNGEMRTMRLEKE